MNSIPKVLRSAAALFVFVLTAGCTQPHIQPIQRALHSPPLFPPRTVMQTGDYKAFFERNSQVLKSCKDPGKCAQALFNLSFLYCYPKSPYYSRSKALKYIRDLIAGAPKSTWAFQAIVWRDIIERDIRTRIIMKRRITREEIKAKEEPEPPEMPDQSTLSAQEKAWEEQRQCMEDEIKSKDEIIKKLNKQIERSQQIDIEIEERERGLLH